MKKNNKGFLLAETIVTVCIIATLATSMYIYVSKTANRFEERDNYEGVVDVYKLNTIRKYLNDNNCLSSEKASSSTDLVKNTTCVPSTLKTELSLSHLYFIEAKIQPKTNLLTYISNNTDTKNLTSLKDYLNYIPIDDNEIQTSQYRLIGMFQESGKTPTFANIIIDFNE